MKCCSSSLVFSYATTAYVACMLARGTEDPMYWQEELTAGFATGTSASLNHHILCAMLLMMHISSGQYLTGKYFCFLFHKLCFLERK